MTYLSDRRSQRVSLIYKLVGVCFLAITVIFWVQIRLFLSPLMFSVSSGVFNIKMTTENSLDSINSFFSTKRVLEDTINLLEQENNTMANEIAEKDSIIASFDEAYKTETKPNASTVEVFPFFSPLTHLYGTFIISKGFKNDIQEGMIVYGSGYIPIGKVIRVGTQSSVVELLSADGNELEGLVIGSSTEKTVLRLTGMGGGDFIASLPKDIKVETGATVVWKENQKMKLGTVVSVDNVPQAISQKLLIRGMYSPTNATRLFIDIQ